MQFIKLDSLVLSQRLSLFIGKYLLQSLRNHALNSDRDVLVHKIFDHRKVVGIVWGLELETLDFFVDLLHILLVIKLVHFVEAQTRGVFKQLPDILLSIAKQLILLVLPNFYISFEFLDQVESVVVLLHLLGHIRYSVRVVHLEPFQAIDILLLPLVKLSILLQQGFIKLHDNFLLRLHLSFKLLLRTYHIIESFWNYWHLAAHLGLLDYSVVVHVLNHREYFLKDLVRASFIFLKQYVFQTLKTFHWFLHFRV